MPPCGYRDAGIEGMVGFLSDNLEYFLEMHGNSGNDPQSSLDLELEEIHRIKSGSRGDAWVRAVVVLNEEFYMRMAQLRPKSWVEVKSFGDDLIRQLEASLRRIS